MLVLAFYVFFFAVACFALVGRSKYIYVVMGLLGFAILNVKHRENIYVFCFNFFIVHLKLSVKTWSNGRKSTVCFRLQSTIAIFLILKRNEWCLQKKKNKNKINEHQLSETTTTTLSF